MTEGFSIAPTNGSRAPVNQWTEKDKNSLSVEQELDFNIIVE